MQGGTKEEHNSKGFPLSHEPLHQSYKPDILFCLFYFFFIFCRLPQKKIMTQYKNYSGNQVISVMRTLNNIVLIACANLPEVKALLLLLPIKPCLGLFKYFYLFFFSTTLIQQNFKIGDMNLNLFKCTAIICIVFI